MIIREVDTGLLYEIQPTKQHGENAMTCPVCSPSRKKKRDKCFSWNCDENVGRCNHCQASFVKHGQSLKEKPAKEYVSPVWRNKTDLTDKAVKWFESRMISQGTLEKMRIHSDTVWMPQFRKEVEVMRFPYFLDGNLRNVKSRGPMKSFKMESGAELIFYNIDCITPDTKELIICEGEMDALSFIDAGHPNVVSVPNGAGSTEMPFLDNYADRLERIEKFYIATDFDEPGLKLRNELIRRLGAERCKVVTYEGRKDANDLFKSQGGLAIHRILQNAEDIPVEGSINLESRYDDILMMYRNGLPEGERIGMPEIDRYIRWQTSRLAIWTGIPSHGKSEMVDFVTLRLCLNHGWRTLFFSPENFPLEFHYAKLAGKLTGKEFKEGKMTEEEFDKAYEFIQSNFFWLDPYGEADLESILKRTSHHIRNHGVRQLVIDPYNCMEHLVGRGENESTYAGRFLDKLTRFARKNDVLIHLVAHPRKPEKDKSGKYMVPGLYDISGSANFYNKADYGLTVYRNFEENRTSLYVTKVKFKNLGHTCLEGVELQYNDKNGRYETPTGDIYSLDNSNWIEGPKVTEGTEKPFDFEHSNETAPF